MSTAGTRRRDNERLGAVLREAREKHGLSQRQLAERMNISWVAISQAENGADIRHETLRDFLKALPGLTPAELLQGAKQPTTRTRRDVWTYYRDLMGMEAHSIEKELVVLPDRGREDRFRCTRLRSIRSNPSDLRLLQGLESAAYMGSRPVIAELHAGRGPGGEDEDSVLSRVLERREGRLLQVLNAPAELARDGLTYSWKRTREGANWREDTQAFKSQPVERIHSGFGHRVDYPVRRLMLRLHLPEGYWPETAYLRTWPSTAVPDPRVRDFTEQMHPEGLKLRRDRRRRLVSLTVEYPLIDWSYNIGWILPSKPGA